MSTIDLPLYEYALAATQPDHGFGTVSRGSLETAREALADAIRTLREIERMLQRWQQDGLTEFSSDGVAIHVGDTMVMRGDLPEAVAALLGFVGVGEPLGSIQP